MSNSRGGSRPGAGRPKSEETKLVRVPVGAESLVKHLISVYKNFDSDDISDVVADVLHRASRYPELESQAVLLQFADLNFCHSRRLGQHLMNIHGVIVEKMD